MHLSDDILDHIHDAVIVTDLNSIIIAWNHGAEKQLGYGADEVIGRPVYILYLNSENSSFSQNKLLSILEEKGEIQFEALMQKKSGEKIQVHTSLSPIFDAGNRITRVVSYTLDITEQKRNEEKLKQQARMIDYIHDAVIVTDLNGAIRQWNKGAERQIGYMAQEVIGRPVYVLYPRTKTRLSQDDLINLLGVHGILSFEAVMRKKSGDEIIVHTSLSPIIDIDENITGVISYTLDVTEQRNAEKIRREKERIDNELQIAHDIQMNMVPGDFPLFERNMGVDLFARLVPARGVGGDLYDAFSIDKESIFFAVGDISGKGVPAALMMAKTVTLIRSLARQHTEPHKILEQANKELAINNESCMFSTAICGTLNCRSGRIKYANAGHQVPVHVDTANHSSLIQGSLGLPLGISEGAGYETHEMDLPPDDILILYSDGVTEAFNTEREQFGEQRLLKSAARATDNARSLVENIIMDVEQHAGEAEQSDDIVVLALRRASASTPV
jgi:PAS domain S-box-containing protein